MKNSTRQALTVMVMIWGAVGLGAQAQDIYRCGNTYGQTPCAGGQVIETPAAARTESPQRDRSVAAQRDARAAAILEQQRLRLEAQAAPAYIANPARATETARPQKTPAHKPEVFTAVAPAVKDKRADRKKKKKSAQAKPAQRKQTPRQDSPNA